MPHRLPRADTREPPSPCVTDVRLQGHGEPVLSYMDRITSCFNHFVDRINFPIYAKLNADVAAALTNVRHAAVWERLDPTGPKLGRFTDACPLTSVNFVRCPGWAKSPVELEDLDVPKIDPKRVRAAD